MAKTICVREGKIVENKEIVYFKHFWEHILYKQMLEIEQRYFGKVSLATDLYDELRVKFEGKNVIAFIDFSVATACSLNYKACTQWMPYLKNRKLFSAQEVHGWFENIFQWVDYIHIVSPFGGEAFLNPEFADILEDMLIYQKEGKIGYIRLVTNGTVFPDEKLQKMLCNPNILILVSNYGDRLTDRQAETYQKFIAFLKEHNCKYYEPEMEWTDLGVPKGKKELNEQQRKASFSSCFIRDCAGIYEGNLYHCPRVYALENMGMECSKGDEVVRFDEIHSREEMREKLERFYEVEELSACQWCNVPEERVGIPAAEQILTYK